MTPLPIPTVSELKSLFAAAGVRPNRRLGQNFLIDPEQMRFIADAAELTSRDVVLEPGPGTGGLTGLTADRAAAVIAVELDRKLFELASRRLAPLTNVRVLHANIMGRDDAVAPEAMEAVQAALSRVSGSRLKVVSNLPYGPSTAFIAAMLAGAPQPADMVVMVQREVAARLCAPPGSPDYGYLSVLVQLLARVETLRRLSPKAFWPQPEIDSAVVRVTPLPAPPTAGDAARLAVVVGGVFRHRRKQIVSSLVTSGLTASRQSAGEALSRASILPSARPEELAPADFVRLVEALR